MPRSSNQKTKLLYLAKFLTERTDERHSLKTQELIDLLAGCGIPADRKTLYTDMEELQRFGLDIVVHREGKSNAYALASREFELPELKLLVDSVQAARFVSESKSRALIKKLESLVSVHEARQLHRQVIVSGRVKTGNETVYYSVDTLHTAINANVQVTFRYFQWDLHKQMRLRRAGALYRVSPWALVWEDENYYLIGYAEGAIRHYRVDKMLHLRLDEAPREGQEAFHDLELPQYSNSLFGMFAGKIQDVDLLCANELIGVMIDRFGPAIPVRTVDEDHFATRVHVCASRPFLGWIFSLGGGVQITGPESMVDAMRMEAQRLARQYPST